MATAALSHVRNANEKLQERIARIRTEHKSAIRETMGAGISIGTAFGIGYLEGRYPERMLHFIAGFPLSLVAGGVGLALAGFEVGGAEAAQYIGDAGRGALAAWAAGAGGAIGREQAAPPARTP